MIESADYEHSVFINSPLDDAYRDLFQAIVFATHACGFDSHCALEVDDGSEVRIEKISRLIAECRLGVHDISRTQPDVVTGLPRFNMPLELGLFLGAKRFGRPAQRRKTCLILDIEPYRYQKFISDIAGQDIASHNGDVAKAIRVVRDWLSNTMPKSAHLPSGSVMAAQYLFFRDDLPGMCSKLHLRPDELTFNNYVVQVEEWLKTSREVAR